VPFAPAFAIIAAIIVEEMASPKLPRTKDKINKEKFLIINVSNNAEYNNAIIVFIQKTRIILNISLPEKTVDGALKSCRVKDVPLSSSETKARESPDIAVKNITTQNKPPVRLSETFSRPTANIIILIATMINIASELIAYRVLNSE
jgi:predicted outer membrane lipoprotein